MVTSGTYGERDKAIDVGLVRAVWMLQCLRMVQCIYVDLEEFY